MTFGICQILGTLTATVGKVTPASVAARRAKRETI